MSVILRLLLSLFIFCISANALAAVSMSTLELGTGIRVEQDTDGVSLDGQMTFSVAASLNVYHRVDLTAEFSIFSETESESILSVSRDHYEFMGWGKYTLYSEDRFDLQMGGGLGFFWESFQTQVGAADDQVSSGVKLLVGGLLGGHYRLQDHWALGLDLRLVGNTNSSLSPVFDAMAKMKYLF